MDLEPDMVHRKSLPQFRMVLITRSLTSVWLFRAKTEEQNNKVGNSQESVNWPQGGTTTASPENTSSIKTWSYKQVGFGRVTWSTAQNLGKQHKKKKKRTKKHRNKKQKQKRGEDRGNHSAALVWSTIMVVYGSLPHISFSVNQRCAVSFQLDYPGLRKEDGCVCVCVVPAAPFQPAALTFFGFQTRACHYLTCRPHSPISPSYCGCCWGQCGRSAHARF